MEAESHVLYASRAKPWRPIRQLLCIVPTPAESEGMDYLASQPPFDGTPLEMWVGAWLYHTANDAYMADVPEAVKPYLLGTKPLTDLSSNLWLANTCVTATNKKHRCYPIAIDTTRHHEVKREKGRVLYARRMSLMEYSMFVKDSPSHNKPLPIRQQLDLPTGYRVAKCVEGTDRRRKRRRLIP